MAKYKSEEFQIDMDSINNATILLRALRSEARQKMLALLHKYQSLPVKEIYRKMNTDQPAASMHLAILRKAGIVNTYKEGLFVYYSINYNRVKQVENVCRSLMDTSQLRDFSRA